MAVLALSASSIALTAGTAPQPGATIAADTPNMFAKLVAKAKPDETGQPAEPATGDGAMTEKDAAVAATQPEDTASDEQRDDAPAEKPSNLLAEMEAMAVAATQITATPTALIVPVAYTPAKVTIGAADTAKAVATPSMDTPSIGAASQAAAPAAVPPPAPAPAEPAMTATAPIATPFARTTSAEDAVATATAPLATTADPATPVSAPAKGSATSQDKAIPSDIASLLASLKAAFAPAAAAQEGKAAPATPVEARATAPSQPQVAAAVVDAASPTPTPTVAAQASAKAVATQAATKAVAKHAALSTRGEGDKAAVEPRPAQAAMIAQPKRTTTTVAAASRPTTTVAMPTDGSSEPAQPAVELPLAAATEAPDQPAAPPSTPRQTPTETVRQPAAGAMTMPAAPQPAPTPAPAAPPSDPAPRVAAAKQLPASRPSAPQGTPAPARSDNSSAATSDPASTAEPIAAEAPQLASPTTVLPLPTPSAAVRTEDVASPAPSGVGQADQVIDRHLDVARDNQWLDRLARDISQAATQQGHLKFHLNPERLGALTIEITNGAAGAAIRMTTETDQARTIIADAQPRLIADVQAQGLRVAEARVDVSQNNNQNNNQSNGQNSGGGSASPQAHSGQSGQMGQQRQSSADHQPFARTQAAIHDDAGDSASHDDGDLYA